MKRALRLLLIVALAALAGAGARTPRGNPGSIPNRVAAAPVQEIRVGDPGYGPTLQDAVTAGGAANAAVRVPAGTYDITADLTIPVNITLKPERGAVLAVARGKTLAINGGLEAGLHQIFSVAGSGKVLFGPRAVKEVYPQWWGAVADANTDCTAALQAALGSTAAWGGRTYLIDGTYKITATLPLAPYQTLAGHGSQTVISSTSNIDFITVADTSTGARVENLKLWSLSDSFSKYQIHAINPIQARFYQVEIQSTDAATGGGILVDNGAGGGCPQSTFLTTVEQCLIREGKIVMMQTDCKILNNTIWSDKRDYCLKVVYNNNLISGNEFVAGNLCGIYLNYVNFVTIIGNYLGGGPVSGRPTGPAILGDTGANNVKVIGNDIMANGGGIYLQDSNKWTIQGNTFYDNNAFNTNPGGDDIRVTGQAAIPYGIIATGNTHFCDQNQAHNGYAVQEVNRGQEPTANQYVHNQIQGYFSSPYIRLRRDSVFSSSIAGNTLGSTDYGHREGSQPLTAATTQTFSYGVTLPYIPKPSEFTINFTGAAPPPAWYLHDIGDAGFSLTFAAAPSKATTINWKVDLK